MEKNDDTIAVHKSFWQTSDFLAALSVTVGFAFEMQYATSLELPLHSIAGIVVWLIGLAIILIAKRDFAQHEQKSGLGHAPDTLITTGIFKYSRNPIYVGMAVIVLGFGILFDSWWLIGSSGLAIFLMHMLLVRSEELFLLKQFGIDYEVYKKQTRPWL